MSLSRLQVLPQGDPFPGGHRYRLQVQGTEAANALGGLELGRRENLPRSEASRLLHDIDWLVGKVADVPRESGFFLNSVAALDVQASAVTVEGECSPTGWRGPPRPRHG